MGHRKGPFFRDALYIIRGIFRENENCDLEVSTGQSDFEEISDVCAGGGCVPKQESRKHRTNSVRNAITNLKEVIAGYLTSSADMFSGRELAGRKKNLNDLREIGKLRAAEERLRELNGASGELENRIAISGKITNSKLTKESNK